VADPVAEQDILDWYDGRFHGCPALVAAFPGDLHAGRARDDTPLPYLVVNVVGEAPVLHTEDDRGEGTVVRFAAFAPDRTTARRLAALIARHPTAGLDRVASAPMGEDGDAVVTAQRTGGATVLDDDPGESGGQVWMGMVTYFVFISRADR
jgi:hypothetical protein